MDPLLLTYIFLSYLAAGFIKGFSGLGFSTVCVGIMASFLELTTAIPLVVVPSIVSCLLVMIEAGHFRQAFKRFLPMYVATLPGLVCGMWLLVGAEGNLAKAALGIVLVLYGIWGLMNPNFTLSTRTASLMRVPTGFLTGTIHGLTGAAVIPVAPYLLSLGLKNELFIQAVNISFVMSSLVIIAGLGSTGYVSISLLGVSIVGILPVAIAVKLGAGLRKKASDKQFRIAVLVVLVGLGISLVASA